jgi:hypothetical protein
MMVACVLIVAASCGRQDDGPRKIVVDDMKPPKMERVRMIIDEKAIREKDAYEILQPAWLTADIYGSYDDYVASLAKFSRDQRLMVAVWWYLAEVNNGGHGQFYSNSTGIVWEDALEGFKKIGALDAAEILAESAKRLGGRPSFDRDERNRALDMLMPNLNELDNRFFKIGDLEQKILDYMRQRPKGFLFDGEVEKPVAP